MFRHAQSHQCVSSICIRVQEWRHNHRKYSLHPSLTNRYRSSCESQESTIEARNSLSLCYTSFITVWESIILVQTLTPWLFLSLLLSLYAESLELPFQFIVQNHLKSMHLPFSSHLCFILPQQEVLCAFFYAFTLLLVCVFAWITFQMAFKRECGGSRFSWGRWFYKRFFPDLLLLFIQALCICFSR